MTSPSSLHKRARKDASSSAVVDEAQAPIPEPAWPKALFWIWVAVVATIALFQPFELGFYLDDWPVIVDGARHGAPFSATRFAHQFAMELSRPASGLVRYVLSSALSDIPFRWQFGLVLSNVAVALFLALFLGRLVAPEKRVPDRAMIAFALSWLVVPWCAAVRFWPTMLGAAVVVFAVFAAMLAWVVRDWQWGRAPIVFPGLVYLFACTAYEAFYLQWIGAALIGCALCLRKRARWTDVARTCASLLAAQLVAVAWYFASKTFATMDRPVSRGWQDIVKTNLASFVPAMFASAYDTYMLLIFAVAGLIAAIAFGIAAARKTGGLGAIATELMLAGACFAACPLSLVAFSLGERVIRPFGVDTRIYIFSTFWMIAGVALLTTAAVRQSPRVRKAAVIFGALLGVSLAGSGLGRMGDWATAWRLAQKYLAEAPVEQMAALPSGSEILYVGPNSVVGAPVLQARWDINRAMPLTHPATSKLHFTVFWAPNGPMQWDGAQLYDSSGAILQTSALYIWAPEWRQFFKAQGPFTVAVDRTITYWKAPLGPGR